MDYIFLHINLLIENDLYDFLASLGRIFLEEVLDIPIKNSLYNGKRI